MFEQKTNDELHGLSEQYFHQLQSADTVWKGVFFIGGLLSAMGAIFLLILHGIDAFSIVLLLVGVPTIWMWKRDDRQRAIVQSRYDEVMAEIARRGR